MTTTADRIEAVRERIRRACERADRGPASVRLVGVTKGVSPGAVREALAAGLADFGENFVQEAERRIEALGAEAGRARWHFIGHLQTNKVTAALKRFDIIQSVDSLRLAEQLSRRAGAALPILLEVNVGDEASKHGFAPSEVAGAAAAVSRLPNLELLGLMTVAPAASDKEAVRPVFRELRALAEANGLAELSMGMTNDFETAIEEGATIVRIGRAIFGERRP